MTAEYPECEQFNGRKRQICRGEAGKLLADQWRMKKWGLPEWEPNVVASAGTMLSQQPPQMPSVFVRGLNFTAALFRHAANGFRTRTPAEIEERLEICQACPYRVDINGVVNCTKCGCMCQGNNDIFLNKLAWTSETCPDGRWT